MYIDMGGHGDGRWRWSPRWSRGGGDNSDMIDDVASRTDTAHTHAHNGWLGMDQGSAGAFDKRLPQWTAPALLCSCPPALLQLLLLLLLLALLAA